ncbi:hypothetical protein ACLOJK_040929 [Asimina triloba]
MGAGASDCTGCFGDSEEEKDRVKRPREGRAFGASGEKEGREREGERQGSIDLLLFLRFLSVSLALEADRGGRLLGFLVFGFRPKSFVSACFSRIFGVGRAEGVGLDFFLLKVDFYESFAVLGHAWVDFVAVDVDRFMIADLGSVAAVFVFFFGFSEEEGLDFLLLV